MALDGYAHVVTALLFILALIGLAAWLAQRFGLSGTMLRAAGRRRLALVEVLPVDAKRRLVLLRRDEVEHLVLLGTGTDLLLESGIRAASSTGAAPAAPPSLPEDIAG